jgi:hypothetical protein
MLHLTVLQRVALTGDGRGQISRRASLGATRDGNLVILTPAKRACGHRSIASARRLHNSYAAATGIGFGRSA